MKSFLVLPPERRPAAGIERLRNIGNHLEVNPRARIVVVAPGVAEVTRLQQREGYAYLKP